MSETTKLPASFSNGAVFESSTAFLMIQKNANKRQTSMTDDVFRIFRRTGKKINEIAKRIEGERCIYLKDSYSEKNTLYKELSGIANIKEGQNDRRRAKMSNHIPPLPRFSTVNTSDLIYRPVKSQLGRQKLGEESEHEPEKRINVNVLKRCECCRRLAFMYKEMAEKQRIESEEEDQKKKQNKEDDDGQKTTSETQKLTQEVLASVKATPNTHGEDASGRKKSKLFYYAREKTAGSRKISISEVVPTSFNSLRKQSKVNLEAPQRRVTVNGPPATAPSSPAKFETKSRNRSYSVLMNSTEKQPMPYPEPTPSPLGRQRIRVKFENPNAKEKIKIQGTAWSNHLRRLHGHDQEEKQTVATLSKAYVAFKKLLRTMEEERRKEEEAENQDNSPTSSCRNSPILKNRYQNTVSLAMALRWQPRRNSKRADSLIPPIDPVINDNKTDTEKNCIEEDVSQPNDSDKNVGTFTILDCNS